MATTIKQILAATGPLTPREQKQLVRSTTILLNRVRRIAKHINEGLYADEFSVRLPGVRASMERDKAQAQVQLAALQARGTRTK